MKEITYSDAIEKVMLDNGGFATLQYIYDNFEKYREKTGKTPDNTIQERVQRDPRFTRIARGVYGLTDKVKEIEELDKGLALEEDGSVYIKDTEREIRQNIRIGQQKFRENLIKELNKCPITQIDDEKLLIASHIKPWVYSNDSERLNYHNGFLLSPLYDKLFDKSIGLITFTMRKKVLISKRLSKENIKRLDIEDGQIIKDLPVEGRKEFLEFHQNYIFQD